jgi:16S rRNA pseudouridine516 synthase
MRVDKFLSVMGIASRREAAAAAKSGMILVDGVPMRDASKHIDPENQRVVYMGREILYRRYTYVMLNKPEGYVSATEDSKLPVVTELLSDELQRMELFPVGRLDRDTVGLMLLTNNGPLAHTLLSPKHHVKKVYSFALSNPLPVGCEQVFSTGVTLGDGYECKSAELALDEGRCSGKITLTEGKYHQIKRMMASFGSKVTFLKRESFAGIPLDRGLAPGEWRYLTAEEIKSLEEKAK